VGREVRKEGAPKFADALRRRAFPRGEKQSPLEKEETAGKKKKKRACLLFRRKRGKGDYQHEQSDFTFQFLKKERKKKRSSTQRRKDSKGRRDLNKGKKGGGRRCEWLLRRQ